MKRLINYGSIKSFQQIVKDVTHKARYTGLDEKGKVKYSTDPLPIISCIGTEKIHGTNVGFSFNEKDGFWCQSKKRILSVEEDHYGFAFYCEGIQEVMIDMIKSLSVQYSVDLESKGIIIYGEWCGGSIQKKSAVSGLGKKLMIFRHCKIYDIEPTEDSVNTWVETKYNSTWIDSQENQMWNITNFPSVSTLINFNEPKRSINKMLNNLEKNESDSPVGNTFGVENNTLEGYVYTFEFNGEVYKFKVKGGKHSSSKVKTLKPVDDVLEQKKQDFVTEYCCRAWRLEQMYKEVQEEKNQELLDIEDVGKFLKKVNSDIIKEESDEMRNQGLVPKQIFPLVSRVSVIWFKEQLNNM